MIIFDFNSGISNGQIWGTLPLKGLADEYRAYHFFPTYGFHSETPIQSMRPSLSRQLSLPEFFMFRPVPLYGICSTDLSGITPRRRNVSVGDETQTLSRWLSRPHLQEHSCRCQREAVVADLRRLCTTADSQSTQTLCRREFRRRTQKLSLRA